MTKYLNLAQNTTGESLTIPMSQKGVSTSVKETVLSGSGDPTSSTQAKFIGQTYINTDNDESWFCTEVADGTKRIGYTVTGSPTISSAGVLSNITDDNYISKSGKTGTTKAVFYTKITVPSTITQYQAIMTFNNSDSGLRFNNATGTQISFHYYGSNRSTATYSSGFLGHKVWLVYEATKSNSSYSYLYYLIDDNDTYPTIDSLPALTETTIWTKSTMYTGSYHSYFITATSMIVGKNPTLTGRYFTGSIDLSCTKIIYNDGEYSWDAFRDAMNSWNQAEPKNSLILKNLATGASSLNIAGLTTYQSNYSVGVGCNTSARATYSVAIGCQTTSMLSSTAIGYYTTSQPYSVAIGCNTSASNSYTIAIGYNSYSNGVGSIILGNGSNTESKTFKVALNDTSTRATDEATGLYTLLDSKGRIPVERNPLLVPLSSSTAPTKETQAKAVGQTLYCTEDDSYYYCSEFEDGTGGQKEAYTKAGDPTITDGVMSNITKDNYIYCFDTDYVGGTTSAVGYIKVTFNDYTGSYYPTVIAFGKDNNNAIRFVSNTRLQWSYQGISLDYSSGYNGHTMWIAFETDGTTGSTCSNLYALIDDNNTYPTVASLPEFSSSTWLKTTYAYSASSTYTSNAICIGKPYTATGTDYIFNNGSINIGTAQITYDGTKVWKSTYTADGSIWQTLGVIDDTNTASTKKTWSASKLNTTIGNLESLIEAL